MAESIKPIKKPRGKARVIEGRCIACGARCVASGAYLIHEYFAPMTGA